MYGRAPNPNTPPGKGIHGSATPHTAGTHIWGDPKPQNPPQGREPRPQPPHNPPQHPLNPHGKGPQGPHG